MEAHGVTPILNVSSVRESIAWFNRIGFHTCWGWPTNEAPTFAAVQSGVVQLFLCENGQGGRGPNTSTAGGPEGDDTMDKGVWMSIWVVDVDAVHAECIAQGLDVTQPPTDELWGVREMHLRHPDGHVLRISRGHQPHKGA